jgi:hypothetical protein
MSGAVTIREWELAPRDDWVFVIAAPQYRHPAKSEDLNHAAARISLVSWCFGGFVRGGYR